MRSSPTGYSSNHERYFLDTFNLPSFLDNHDMGRLGSVVVELAPFSGDTLVLTAAQWQQLLGGGGVGLFNPFHF